jgi:hypothetical protein
VTRIIIAHHRETTAAADGVLRVESGRVLGTEAAEPSLLAAAAKSKQLKLVYALRDISVKHQLSILSNIWLRQRADG